MYLPTINQDLNQSEQKKITSSYVLGITFKGGRLYLYGGMVETGDKDLTLCVSFFLKSKHVIQ